MYPQVGKLFGMNQRALSNINAASSLKGES